MKKRADAEKAKSSKHDEMTLSTRVVNQLRDGWELMGAITSLTETGAAALEERLATVLADGEEMPDIRQLFLLMGRLVRHEVDVAEEADTERWLQGMRLLTAQQECRVAKEDLYAETSDVRKTLVDLYGSAYCRRRFGLAVRTPRGAEDLVLEAGCLVRRLGSGSRELPPPRIRGVKIERRTWVSALKPKVAGLERLLREVEVGKIGVGDRVMEKQRALESSQATYLDVAHSIEALFVLAGQTELAKRVRSSARRRARAAEARRSPRLKKVMAVVAPLGGPRRVVRQLGAVVVSLGEWLETRARRQIGRILPDFEKVRAFRPARELTTAENL